MYSQIAFEIDIDENGRDAGALLKAQDGMPAPAEGFGELVVVNVYDLLPVRFPCSLSESLPVLGWQHEDHGLEGGDCGPVKLLRAGISTTIVY